MQIPSYFETIGLGLPGGGYRAAGFSLGIMTFLNECGMLGNVKSISTVSGGTITGVRYAKSVAEGDTFEDFSKSLKKWLQDDTLLTNALNKLYDESNFVHKRHNLINAFALEYRESVPGTFGDLCTKLENSSTLEEVIFNATDFENGLAFRFKNTDYFGNKEARYKEELTKNIQLGDIIAASSCFPGGFEPMTFPGDFIKGSYDAKEVSLMDGGIIDNQGSSSFFTSNKLKYECYLIADAGSYEIDGFNPANENKTTRRISSLFNIWLCLVSIGVVALLIILKANIWFIILSVILATFFITLQLGLFLLQRFAEKTSGINVPFKIPRSKIGIYLADRVSSVLLLNTSIFLKNSKSSNLTTLFRKSRDKVSKLSIYGLVLENGKPKGIELWKQIQMVIGKTYPVPYSKRSCNATMFDTTLWFTPKFEDTHILDDLIFTGRGVCCLGIISHTIKNIKSTIKADVTSEMWKKHNDKIVMESEEVKDEIDDIVEDRLNEAIISNEFLKEMGKRWRELDKPLKG